MNKQLIEKFPPTLKYALKNKDISFPQGTYIKFDPMYAYRVIPKRENNLICPEDFLSQMELSHMRKTRALADIDENDITQYSCSFYTNKDKLKTIMHMPRKNRVIIQGMVTYEKGISQYNTISTHIHWWLYENVNVVCDFEVISNENE